MSLARPLKWLWLLPLVPVTGSDFQRAAAKVVVDVRQHHDQLRVDVFLVVRAAAAQHVVQVASASRLYGTSGL